MTDDILYFVPEYGTIRLQCRVLQEPNINFIKDPSSSLLLLPKMIKPETTIQKKWSQNQSGVNRQCCVLPKSLIQEAKTQLEEREEGYWLKILHKSQSPHHINH
jgi:hypothetical protein